MSRATRAAKFRTAVEAIIELESLRDEMGGPILAPREIKGERDFPNTNEAAVLARVVGLLELADIDVDMTRFSIPEAIPSEEWLVRALEYIGGELLGLEWIGEAPNSPPPHDDSQRAICAGGR